MTELTHTFEMDGVWYQTDTETITLLRDLVDGFRRHGDNSAIAAIMFLGLQCNRIKEIPQ